MAVADGSHLITPTAGCVFKTPLQFPTGSSDVVLDSVTLIYAGPGTTTNLVTIGATGNGASCMASRWRIRNLFLQSKTAMTAGDGVLLGDTCDFDIDYMRISGGNFFNGLHIFGGEYMKIRSGMFQGANTGEIAHGEPNQPFINLWQDAVNVSNSRVGVNVAGNVGGFYWGSGEGLNNGTQLKISQDGVAVPNQQVMLGGAGLFIDGTNKAAFPASGSLPAANGVGIWITDQGKASGAASKLLIDGAWISFAENECVRIDPTAQNWDVLMTGGNVITCQNAGGTGAVTNLSTSANVLLKFAGTYFGNNIGQDINNVSGAQAIVLTGALFDTAPGKITGSVVGNYVDLNGTLRIASATIRPLTGNLNLSSSNSILFTADSGNILFKSANTAYGIILGVGPGSSCAPRFESGDMVPSTADSTSKGCAYDIGTVVYPFRNVVMSAALMAGAAPAPSGACAIKNQSGGASGGLFQLNATCTTAPLTLTFATSAPTGWICSTQAMPAADSIRQSGFTATTATFVITGSANDWFGVICTGV